MKGGGDRGALAPLAAMKKSQVILGQSRGVRWNTHTRTAAHSPARHPVCRPPFFRQFFARKCQHDFAERGGEGTGCRS